MIVAGVGPGDEVICPSMSYIATANSIKYVGAIPVFAEINPANYNLDVIDAAKKIADALEVSLDYLVGEGINSKLDKQALKRLQDLEQLEDDKKKTI